MQKTSFNWKTFFTSLAGVAIPVALQNLLTTTGSMVDTVMIASLGQNTVGAVGLCSQYSNLVFGCFWGFVAGGMLFISQYYGANDEKGMRRAYGIMWTLVMVVGVLGCLMATAFPLQLMRLFTDKESIQEIGVQYLRIMGFQFPLMTYCCAISAYLRSTGKVKIPLFASIAAVLVNVSLNYILINGKLGFPVLGVRGAAIATVVSQCVNFIVNMCGAWIIKFKGLFDFRAHFDWNRDFLKLYFKRSFPLLCNELLIGVSNTVISIIFGRQSESAIAAYAVISVIEGLYIAFFSGFSNASAIMVGNSVGAGKIRLGYEYGKRLVYLCAAIIALFDIPVLIFANPILTMMGLETESLELGRQMLFVFSAVIVIRMCNWMHNDTFRAAGDSVFGTVMEISFMYILVLPLMYIVAFVIKADFIWIFIARYIDEAIRIVIMQIHLYSGKWIKPVTDEGKQALPAFFAEIKTNRK